MLLQIADFVDNQVRLQLFVLAYSLGNFFRRPHAKMVGKSGFWTYVLDFWAVFGTICLTFRDRFDILLEKRPN